MLRRSLLKSLIALIPVSFEVERASGIPTYGPAKKFEGYRKPKTTVEAFIFITDHGFRFLSSYDGVKDKFILMITDGYWVTSFYHDWPTSLEAHFEEYILPCAVSLWEKLYDH